MTTTIEQALSEATTDQLLNEIYKRQDIFVSAWNVEDFRNNVEQDEDCRDMTEEQVDKIAETFMDHIRGGLEDALGVRGNSYIDDQWYMEKDEIFEAAGIKLGDGVGDGDNDDDGQGDK